MKTAKIYLPVPPSVNALYFNVPKRGRVKTALYKNWINSADALLMTQKPLPRIRGRLSVRITIPAKTRGDASNRIKAAEDFLVSREITGDDKHNWEVCCKKQGTECYVEIISLDSQPNMG